MDFHETTIDVEGENVPVTVEYEYIRGEPDQWYSANGDPGTQGTGDLVSIFSVEDCDGFDWFDGLAESELDKIEAEIYAKHE